MLKIGDFFVLTWSIFAGLVTYLCRGYVACTLVEYGNSIFGHSIYTALGKFNQHCLMFHTYFVIVVNHTPTIVE